jgi:hypothetical protein
VHLRTGLDAVEKRKTLPCRKSNSGLPAHEKEDRSKGKKEEEEAAP